MEKFDTHFVLYVGLPGSGKTTHARQRVEALPFPPERILLLDDFSLRPEQGVAKYNPCFHSCVVITDPKLCGHSEIDIRNNIKQLFGSPYEQLFGDGYKFLFTCWFTYFENDPEACLVNARRSPKEGGTENYIRSLSKIYTIPTNSHVIPVYKS